MKRYWFILFVMVVMSACVIVGAYAEKSSCAISMHPVEAMLSQVQAATVRISVSSENGFRHIGAGFVVSEDGYIITAGHVASKQAQYLAIFGDNTVLEAKVVFINAFTDCAVLKVDHRGLTPITLREEPAFLGEDVFVVGSPVDELFENYVTHGIVSKLRVRLLDLSITDVFMLDAATNPGNSGGPVLDERGQVIGMVIAVAPGAHGLAYAVYASDIADTLEKARRGKAEGDKS
jgi:serine protease Do